MPFIPLAEPMCRPLTAPDNGDIDCTLGDDGVPTVGDRCTFTCDEGFERRGSRRRVCQIRDGRAVWSGRRTTCVRGTVLPNIYLCILFTL